MSVKLSSCSLAITLAVLIVACSCWPLAEWESYKRLHGKHYETFEEDRARFMNYLNRKRKIERHNANPTASYRMELNHLADWHKAALDGLRGARLPIGLPPIDPQSTMDTQLDSAQKLRGYLSELLEVEEDEIMDAPQELDWRKFPNRVTPIKDQGQCGSCYAFSVTGLLEGQQVVRNFTKDLISLSEQEIVACSGNSFGCDGGWPDFVLDDLHSLGGIDSEKEYPYLHDDDVKCEFQKGRSVMTVKGYKAVARISIAMKYAVANYGPISVAFEATDDLFYYKSGVFDGGKCTGQINHAVLIVGYGIDLNAMQAYWIVVSSAPFHIRSMSWSEPSTNNF